MTMAICGRAILCYSGRCPMAEAGWTRNAPTKDGWYWWRNLQKKYAAEQGPFIYMVRWYGKKLAIGNCDIEDSHYTRGEWLGPISSDSHQQWRVAGLRECKHGLDIALDEGPLKAALYRWIDARAERLEREAQEAKGVGDGNSECAD